MAPLLSHTNSHTASHVRPSRVKLEINCILQIRAALKIFHLQWETNAHYAMFRQDIWARETRGWIQPFGPLDGCLEVFLMLFSFLQKNCMGQQTRSAGHDFYGGSRSYYFVPSCMEVQLLSKRGIYLRYTMWCFDIHTNAGMISPIKLTDLSITLPISLFYFYFFLWWEHLRSLSTSLKCTVNYD